METKILWPLAGACLVAACSGMSGTGHAGASAELAFARQESPGGLRGRFTRLDGTAIPGQPAVLHVPAGTRVIEYVCPGTVTVDAYPTVRARFEPGRRYVLECAANRPGIVIAR